MKRPPFRPVIREITFQRTWSVWLATGFGSGFSPLFPGSVGGLWGIPLAWLLFELTPERYVGWVIQIVTILILAWLGVPLCTKAQKDLGGEKDPGMIVYDEIVSVPITFLFLSPDLLLMPAVWVVGYLLNRVFDIVKPYPAHQLEKLPYGKGIMADDLFAGIYSCITLHLLIAVGFFHLFSF
ncbi:Phosphatidylglycerophosphatase A [Planctomycetales bacterium 10988]|nr:Phosphatidylglycerophosphatase A [Planctomycetales bacterium 10988]